MKSIIRTLTSLIAIIFFSAFARAQLSSLKFNTYSTENGLTDNYIVKTATDTKGFLWIATRNGLSRFDGLVFTNYNLTNKGGKGLRSAWITDLLVDKKGTLWVSTEGGLCYYNLQLDSFTYINPVNKLTVLYKAPMCLLGDDIWIAVEEGLKKINTVTKSITPTSLQRIPDPQCICADDEGNIWIGTRGHGFYVYTINKNTWKKRNFSVLPDDAHLMGFYKEQKNIWVATSEGLLQIQNFDSARLYNKVHQQPSEEVNALTFVNSFPPALADSLLLCGTYHKQLAVFNKHSGSFTEILTGDASRLYTIPNSILNNAEVKEQMLWISTDKGLCALNMQTQNFTSYLLNQSSATFSKSMVRKIVQHSLDENKLLLLLNKPAAVVQYNSKTNSVERTWNSTGADVKYRNILKDSDGNIWLIRMNGLDKFSVHKGIQPVYESKNEIIFSAAFDVQNTLWLGTGSGLINYNTSTGKATPYTCVFNGTEVENNSYELPFYTSDLVPDNKGKIWLSSGKYGLFCFDTTTKKFTSYRQPFTGAYETKNRLSGLRFGTTGLWASTMNGFSHFDTAKKTFINYNQKNGISSSYIYAIGVAGNAVIGRGNSGIVWFNLQQKNFINYTPPLQMSSGILDQSISIVNNKAYVGFEGGFTVYNLKPNSTTVLLPVYITGCYLANQRYPLPTDTSAIVQFDYQQNDLQIDFACVNYNEPENIHYQYRMAGMGKEWIDIGTQRSLLFMNLPPGNYTFLVAAADDKGNRSKRPAVLRFSIQPPFWNTAWFKVLAALLIAGTVGLIFYLRIQKIRKTEAQKTAANKMIAELEMKALRSQMNPHFIFNSLNSIQKFIWENRQEDAAEYLTKFARLIRSILENSANKLVLLQYEITSLKLYLELEHRRSNQKFDYSISVEESISNINIMIPPLLLQPYIENAIWHGLNPKKTHGQLTITFLLQGKQLTCTIDDDGIGRAASQYKKPATHKSMGLNISHQRIDLMQQESGIHADVMVTDKKDADGQALGTLVTLTLPLIISPHA